MRIGMVMLVLCAALVGCAGQVSEQATDAVQAVGRLDSCVQVGISYDDYSTEVRAAKAAVDGFIPSGKAESAIHEEAIKAMQFHLMAHEAWTADVKGDWHTSPRSTVSYWPDAYPELEFDLGDHTTVDRVRQEAWSRASEHVGAARKKL